MLTELGKRINENSENLNMVLGTTKYKKEPLRVEEYNN